MNQSNRVRIRIMQRDGSCPADGEMCLETDGTVPFPRGQNVQISIVNDDGSETRLRNVKRARLVVGARSEAVTAVLELYNPVIDAIVPAELIETGDPGGGSFLGEDRDTPVAT
jgi:hypothetical protein